MEHSPTAELVIEAQKGSRSAFDILFCRHKRRIETLARRLVFEPTLAEDVAQETFEAAWISLSALRDPHAFESWLYGIALRIGRRHLSREKRQKADGDLGEPASIDLQAQTSGGVNDERYDPQRAVEQLELNEWVLRAVETLPDRLRAPTVLHYYEYLTVAEIASLLGISVSATKVRLHRSRNVLRHTISNRYNAEYFREYRQRRVEAMVQVEVIDVAESSDGTAVLLFDRQSVSVLPVFVGPAEAAALSHALVAKTFSRPLTYELVQGMLSSLGAEVRHVRIESLQRPTGVFIGVVTLELAAEEKEMDSRPSDAINIALRCGAPIYVAPSVMEVAIEVASMKSTTEFRPRGAESLASRSLRFSPRRAAEAESIEPIVSTNDESLQEVSTRESQAMTPDITRERIKLLSDYVVALAVDADG